MEAYWKMLRPELEFELVNWSQAQLDRLLCEGRAVYANAETYLSPRAPYDLVIITYVLGHVGRWVKKTLRKALANLQIGGTLLVYDVFDGTDKFRTQLVYDTPRLRQMEEFGVEEKLRFRYVIQGGIPLGSFFAATEPWVEKEATPGLFVFTK